MSEMIDTKNLEIDAEYINNAMEMAERGAAMAVTGAITAGVRLIKVKGHLPHGEWAGWIGRNLNYSQAKAIRYMRIASNSSCVINLKDAESVNEALRMIADSKPETVPRSERKPADVVVSIPDDEPDDDPTPDPPTIRKTAKGSEKVSEEKKPKTAAITPEILPDDSIYPTLEPRDESEIVSEWLATTGFIDIVNEALEMKPDFAPKSAAKVLRKLADKLDPTTSTSEEAENEQATEKPRNPESCLGPNGRPRVQKVKFRYIQP